MNLRLFIVGLWVFAAMAAAAVTERDYGAVANKRYENPVEALNIYRSMLQQVNQKKQPDLWVKFSSQLIACLLHVGSMSEVKILLEQALPLAESLQLHEFISRLLVQQHVFLTSSKQEPSDDILIRAIDHARKAQDPSLESLALVLRSQYEQAKGHPAEAAKALLQAQKILQNTPRDAKYLAAHYNIVFVLDANGFIQPNEAIKLYRDLSDEVEKQDLHFLALLINEALTGPYIQNGQLDEALQTISKVEYHARLIKDEVGLARATLNRAVIFTKKKQWNRAIAPLANAQAYFKKFGNQNLVDNSDLISADILLHMQKPEEALHILNRLNESVDRDAVEPETIVFLKLEADTLEALGRSTESSANYKKISELQQELYNSRNLELTNRYYAEFEVERQDQKNTLLKQQNKMQGMEIEHRSRLTFLTLLALAVTIVALSALTYSFFRVRSSKKKVVALQHYVETQVLQRFLPPEIVKEISTGRSRLDEKAKVEIVTVIFADLCEFTRATDRMGTETIAHILNDFFQQMTDVIFSEGGTIDKFIGDAIMVIFGAPTSLPPEEQARKAVACARKMLLKIEELDRKWQTDEKEQFLMRVGIHQGKGVVGSFGGHKRADYTVVGSNVNIAARIESLAEPNTILISDSITLFLDSNEFELRGTFQIRGLDGTMPLYRLKQTDASPNAVEEAS